ncbi:MAG TPA: CinA family protein, partial [candidate division Zixibacteria bacterium]|nr:CinA family protein [candidate division Zixibacteria bacterium]
IALSTADKVVVRREQFGAERDRNRERSATIALDMIRRYLIGQLIEQVD